MKIDYAVTLEDFRSLQPPFTLRPASGLGFKLLIAFCVFMMGAGVFSLLRGFGFAVGGFTITLSAMILLVMYLLDRRSVNLALLRQLLASISYTRGRITVMPFFSTLCKPVGGGSGPSRSS